MAIRYHLSWLEKREDKKLKLSSVSPHVEHRGLAILWLIRQRPALDLGTLIVKEWDRNRGIRGV